MEWRTVVGVARDVRQSPTDEDLADLYVPLLQAPGRFVNLMVRSRQPAVALTPALRQALKEIDPEIAFSSVAPLREAVEQQLDRPRFLAGLLGAFAGMAGVVALVGVYGVVAYAVKQREREIAVRMALGASVHNLTLLFVRQGAVVLAAGVAAGLYGATLLGRLLETQLFGVRSGDTATLATAGATLLLAGLAASWWPARRAARTDPAVVLREE
jgi:ABC-type antimicrobial peptide transport system permease subunit